MGYYLSLLVFLSSTCFGALIVPDKAITQKKFNQQSFNGDSKMNLGLSASAAAGALTVNLKQADGTSDCSAAAPCLIAFHGTASTAGSYSTASVTSALSVTLPSGVAVSWIENNKPSFYRVWAINNAGSIVLGISGSGGPNDSGVFNTAAIASCNSFGTVCTSSALFNVRGKVIGTIYSTDTSVGIHVTPTLVTTAKDNFTGYAQSTSALQVWTGGARILGDCSYDYRVGTLLTGGNHPGTGVCCLNFVGDTTNIVCTMAGYNGNYVSNITTHAGNQVCTETHTNGGTATDQPFFIWCSNSN